MANISGDNSETREAGPQAELPHNEPGVRQKLATTAEQHPDVWLNNVFQSNRESLGIAIAFARQAIQGLILANGGAAIALLAFLGDIWTSSAETAQTVAGHVTTAMSFLITGLFFALLCGGLSYISQVLYTEDPYFGTAESKARKWAQRMRIAAVTSAFLSFLAFGAGCLFAVNGFGIEIVSGQQNT